MASVAKKQEVKAPVKPQTGTQVAKTGDKGAVALPDYMKQGQARGSENVGSQDLVIPRIELIQALSPALKRNDPAFIDGAASGMLFNSVTRELYGDEVKVCPIYFRKEWLVWKDRKEGGGFGGSYSTQVDANAIAADRGEEWEAQETAQHVVLVVTEDGTEEAVISMSRTKLKVSRNWNSLIRLNGNDRFSRIYNLFGVEEKNANGQDYFNFGIETESFASEAVYLAAEKLYKAITSGERNVVVDDKYDNEGAGGDTSNAEM